MRVSRIAIPKTGELRTHAHPFANDRGSLGVRIGRSSPSPIARPGRVGSGNGEESGSPERRNRTAGSRVAASRHSRSPLGDRHRLVVASEPVAVTVDTFVTVQLKPATFVEQLPGSASNCAGSVAVKLAVCVAPLVLRTDAETLTALPLRVQLSGSTIEPPTIGALCPEALMKRAIAEMNLGEVTIIYGLTEASPGITQTKRDDSLEHRTQTVGTVLPEMEVKIIDPATCETLGIEQAGELCVRGYNVMKGYYNNAEATRAAIDEDGWLRTGDQATLDADGYVRITGRIKDIIIRGGENISPKEIEDLLRRHPAVSDVYVYAVKSEFFGEEVAAAVRLKPAMAANEEELKTFCQAGLARFKTPRYWRFVDEFPMTASGKIQKFKLRETHEAELL